MEREGAEPSPAQGNPDETSERGGELADLVGSVEVTVEANDLRTHRDLLVAYEPRVITSWEEAEAANAVIDALTDLRHLSEDQRDFIGLLGQLVYDWESTHDEPMVLTPSEKVRCLLEDAGLRQQDLVGPVFPTRSAVSDFLAGRRPITYDRVEKLAAFFHVSPAAFFAGGRKSSS
jgi:HTH-type transcriptional regulator/antitoxin HigA